MSRQELSVHTYGSEFKPVELPEHKLALARQVEHFGAGELKLRIPKRWTINDPQTAIGNCIVRSSLDQELSPLDGVWVLTRYLKHCFPTVNGLPQGFDPNEVTEVLVPYDDFVVDTLIFNVLGDKRRTIWRAFGLIPKGQSEVEWVYRCNTTIDVLNGVWPRAVLRVENIARVMRNPFYASEKEFYWLGDNFKDVIRFEIDRLEERAGLQYKPQFNIDETLAKFDLVTEQARTLPASACYTLHHDEPRRPTCKARYRRFQTQVTKALSDPQQAPENIVNEIAEYYRRASTPTL